MSTNSGFFCWYEYLAQDHAAAEEFYRRVVGWEMKDPGMSAHRYTILSVGPKMVGGMMEIPDEARARGVPPCWTGYIWVESVDDYIGRVTAAGGALVRPAEDIAGVGRFAVVADLHGAVFILFRDAGGPAPGTPGTIGWHELQAGDGPAAFAFYAGLFGWTKGEAIDMGPMGVYQIFEIGGVPAGGMMTKQPQAPKTCWNYYINVEAADAALARVKEAGGQVVNGPMQVPGGSWILHCIDPQGGFFALVAPKR